MHFHLINPDTKHRVKSVVIDAATDEILDREEQELASIGDPLRRDAKRFTMGGSDRRGLLEETLPETPSSAGANATIIIAVILTAAAIYLLQGLLAPFVFAVFLLIVIGGLSRVLRQVAPGMPRPLAMGIAVIIMLAACAAIGWIAFDNISRLLADSEDYSRRLNAVALDVQRQLGIEVPARIEALTGRLDLSRAASIGAGWLQTSISATSFMLIYLVFMIARANRSGARC